MDKSVFEILNAINVNEHTEGRNGFTYLSWAYAWAEVKKAFPDANYTIYENEDGIPYITDGMTAWVKTGVTINGQEHIEFLPVMDFKNRSIPLGDITSFDVNKAIQRSLTKCCARHGLGLYIYAGEDLPEEEKKAQEEKMRQKIDEKTVAVLEEMALHQGLNKENVLKYYKIKSFAELTEAQYAEVLRIYNEGKK